MVQAKRDPNHVPAIQGVSNADSTTPIDIFVDSVTNRLLVSGIFTLVDIDTLATSAKQLPDGHNVTLTNPPADPQTGLAKTVDKSPLNKYALYATEYGATYNYICKEDKDANWVIIRETISTGVRDYATPANQDPALDPNTATHAWTDRASVDYTTFSGAF